MVFLRYLILSLLGGLALFGGLEGFLRWERPLILGGAYYMEDGNVIRHHQAPGRNREGYTDIDREFEKPPGVYRIVGMGDSMADTPPGLPSGNFHFQTQVRLQEDYGKKVEVINNALGGMSPVEMMNIIRGHSLRYSPDRIAYHCFAPVATIGFDPGKYWTVINGMIIKSKPGKTILHIQEYVEMVKGRVVATRQRLQGSAMAVSETSENRKLSVEERKTRLETELRKEGKDYYLPLTLRDIEQGTFSHQEYVELEGTRAQIYLIGDQEKPWAQSRFDRIRRQISEMRKIVVEGGAEFCIILFADEFQVNPILRQRVCARFSWSEADLDLGKPQRIIKEHCEKEGIPCLDLLPHYLRHPDPVSLFAIRDTHLNTAGNALVADVIARWLVEEGLVPR